MKEACRALCHAGLMRPKFQRGGPTGGRRRLDFDVNPRIFANMDVQSDRPANEAN
jgi:hypothetical protein